MSTETLKNKRANLKGVATRIDNFLSQVSNETSLFELRARLEKLDKLYNEFLQLDESMALQNDAFPERETELEEFECRYFRMKAKYTEVIEGRLHTSNMVGQPLNSTTMHQDAMQKLLQTQTTFLQRLSELHSPIQSTSQPALQQTFNNATQVADVRLPKLNVPVFNGKYAEFKSFLDLFTSCIHNNNSLTSAQKFQYLKGLLDGEPANLIRHLHVSEENYQEAIAKLKDRYDKPTLVVDSLIETFLSIPKAESSHALRNVSNIADEVIRGFRAQGTEAEKRDPWIIHLLCKKVDRDTLQAWAEHSGKESFPNLENFIEFLNKRCDAFERLPSQINEKGKGMHYQRSTRAYTSIVKKTCSVCSGCHHLSYCPTFCRMDIPKRTQVIKDKLLCFNCLKPNHRVQNCPSKHLCNTCHGHHHTLIHADRDSFKLPAPQSSVPAPGSTSSNSNNSAGNSAVLTSTSTEVKGFNMLLPTARVLVKDNMGQYQCCNALLDSGCQNTLISEKCAQRLGLPRKPSKIYVSGLGNSKVGATKGSIELTVRSVHSGECINIQAQIFKELTSKLPNSKVFVNCWAEIKDLPLADDKFDCPKSIDILIGFDYFFCLMRDGRVYKDNNLLAQNTAFGWVICGGCVPYGERPNDDYTLTCHMVKQDTRGEEDLNRAIRLFWELENVRMVKLALTEDDQNAENLYQTTTVRDDRYSVRLPFRNKPDLGESYRSALRRLTAMERKFKSNPEVSQSYIEFMDEYIQLGHMELIPQADVQRSVSDVYYLPHHAVLKDSSHTTKLRVVFDGSSKSTNGKSLNDNLLKGPNMQQDLVGVILRYRTKLYCFAADIKQMFRMIKVQECDRDYQRILWRKSPAEPISHYRLTTVTYGTTPASYLAIRTILQLSEDEKDRFPNASEAVKSSFYVDDCLSGANTMEEALNLASELNNMFTAGGFTLRKWASNDSSILSNIPPEDKIESIVSIPTDNVINLLGIVWSPTTDSFSYRVQPREYCITTKRVLLAEISKIFDPLGWVSPAIIAVKIIIQRLWLLNLDWDDELPAEVKNSAEQLFLDFQELNKIIIPRILFSTETDIKYHGFCDASSAAYAAVIYCRKASKDGVISTNIVMAKTKVAPISTISIPRLELCAAYLLTQMFEYLVPVLHIQKRDIVCWSDSKTVLAWLSSHPSKWMTFISHRSAYILETLPEVKWRYIPSNLNPADCASRGVKSSYLVENKLWFLGPQFLLKDSVDWPKADNINQTTQELRAKHQTTLTSTVSGDVIPMLNEKISRWTRMVRVLAYVLRACKFFRSKSKGLDLPLQVNELKKAEKLFIIYYQKLYFADALESIRKNTPLASKKLKHLSPFVDPGGVLRVGGRLSNADLPYDSMHQVILHKDCPISSKIVRDCHLNNLHAGITLLIATLRQIYWLIGARALCKQIYRNCIRCHRFSAKTNEQLMGNLPKYRVNAAYPFCEVGCDYAGPILYRQHNGRKSPLVKSYIAVFICLVTKAVHLEIVTDLTSDAFMAALDRFIARRGLCAHIYSDNGTNFQGAAKKIVEIYKSVTNFKFNTKVSNFLSSKGVQWHFIPPGAPHFGGVWESTVKSVKYHLKRTIGQAALNYEQLSTLLARIEAVLNSRPLIQVDSDDMPYISPGHFLVGRQLNALPECDLRQLKSSSLNKWRLIQQLTQQFWSRWSTDYILSLQPKAKWVDEKPNICIGDIVLLREDNLPPACWKLGKVIETHAGSDDLVRVATVKTETATYKRPITKLHPLPKDDN